MPKSLLSRAKVVLIETVEELVFGFDYAHPERAKPQNCQQEQQAHQKAEMEQVIAERKKQVRAMRSHEKPSREKARNR